MAANQIDILIGKGDIEAYAQVSILANVEKQLNHYILAAQNLDVKPFLGNAFWTDLMEKHREDPYKLLLSGGTYTYNDVIYSFSGLKAAIASYTYSRYVLTRNAQDTAFGIVNKTTDFSEPVSDKYLSLISNQHKMAGQAYLNEVDEFLKRNLSDYPLYKTESCNEGKKRTKGSIRMTPAGL